VNSVNSKCKAQSVANEMMKRGLAGTGTNHQAHLAVIVVLTGCWAGAE